MIRNSFLVLLILFTPFVSIEAQVNQGPDIAWQQCYGGTNEDYFTDAIVTHDNGILAAIRPLSDNGDLEGMTVQDASGWVIKYKEDMSIQWQKHFGYTDCFREILKIIELANGNIVFGGALSSISGEGCTDEIGGGDFFLLKTDSLGNELWYQTYGSPYQDLLTWMVPTSDGGFLLTGTSMGEGGDIPLHYGGTLSTDAVVLKTDSLGELEWVQVLGGSSFERPAFGIAEVRPDIFQFHIATTSNDYDLYSDDITDLQRWLFVQININGEVVRDRVYSGEQDFYNNGSKVFPYKDGVVAVLNGNSASSLYPTIPEHDGIEGSVLILDSALNILSQKQWGGNLDDYLFTGTKDIDGNFYFLGVSKSENYDVLENHYGGEEENYWILATDSLFNTLWSKSFGGGNNNCGDLCGGVFTGTLIAKDGMLYAFTESISPEVLPDFDIECGHYIESSLKSDAWLVAFDLSTTIQEVPASDLIEIYPIPATDWITIKVPDTSFDRLQVLGLDGKLFYNNTSNIEPTYQIDVSQLPIGMYILQIQLTNGEIYTEKIIVTH
jgi:hypothetical protein